MLPEGVKYPSKHWSDSDVVSLATNGPRRMPNKMRKKARCGRRFHIPIRPLLTNQWTLIMLLLWRKQIHEFCFNATLFWQVIWLWNSQKSCSKPSLTQDLAGHLFRKDLGLHNEKTSDCWTMLKVIYSTTTYWFFEISLSGGYSLRNKDLHSYRLWENKWCRSALHSSCQSQKIKQMPEYRSEGIQSNRPCLFSVPCSSLQCV